MSERWLATFPGKYGDILWSLPTVRLLSQLKGGPVEFAIMPQYQKLLELLAEQSYIKQAMTIGDWQLLHSNYGDQPWHPPQWVERGYERVWHLGYRGHPGMGGQKNMALVDFVADQQGFKFVEPPVPFLEAGEMVPQSYMAMGFNDQYVDLKDAFKRTLMDLLPAQVFMDVTSLSWMEAARVIQNAVCLVGCRSAMAVVAHGLGKKVFTYEPHPQRHKQGMFGEVFGFPYGQEVTAPFGMPPQAAAQVAAATLLQWRKEYANAETVTGRIS